MIERPTPPIPERVFYYEFSEVIDEAKKELPAGWALLRSDGETLVLGRVDENADVTTKVSFEHFSATVSRKGLIVSKCHNVESCGLRRLLRNIDQICWCPGSTPRSKLCSVTVEIPGFCRSCTESARFQTERACKPLTANTPLASATKSALIQEVRTVRSKLKEKEGELAYIQKKLQTEAVSVSSELQDGLKQVMESTPLEQQSPFIQLFWAEQRKAASKDPRGMRWHPMIIRFAIYLHYQSPRSYEALRSTGVLRLPNESTLRDYTSFFRPEQGFQPHVLKELQDSAAKLDPEKRFSALMLDEMSIRGDLVYDRRGGEIIGFVNPSTWTFNQDSDVTLASHVLVFMVVGINNNIKASLGYFATKSATSGVLFPLLWEAVSCLEQQGLKVISVTSDKAAPNQRLYRMHGEGPVVHQTVNYYADEVRPFFFISDAPHLIKTLRNNLESSKSGGSKCLWHNGHNLWWTHVYKLYADDASAQLRRTKLRAEHVRLTPSSRMSVRLAAQVLSRTVGLVMKQYYPEEMKETAHFILQCNRFFDCLNSRSFSEHIKKRNADLAPYKSIDDSRFEFLESFAAFLDSWKENVATRDGFSKSEKDRMFLTLQTYEGMLTTVRGFTGATKYLLGQGVTYVFSNVFCQDPLEEHFGRHRGLGHRAKNPSVYEFGHQENKLRLQRSLAQQFRPRGNTSGRLADNPSVIVDEEPLPKIKRH